MINLKSFEKIQVNENPFSSIIGNNYDNRFYHKLGIYLYENRYIPDKYIKKKINDGTICIIFDRDNINEKFMKSLYYKIIECCLLQSLFGNYRVKPKNLISIKCYHKLKYDIYNTIKQEINTNFDPFKQVNNSYCYNHYGSLYENVNGFNYCCNSPYIVNYILYYPIYFSKFYKYNYYESYMNKNFVYMDIKMTYSNYRIVSKEDIISKLPTFNIDVRDACEEFDYYSYNPDFKLVSYFSFEDDKFDIPMVFMS